MLPKNDFVTISKERRDKKIYIAHDLEIEHDLIGKITAIGEEVVGISVGDRVVFDSAKSAKMKNISGGGEFYVTRERNIKLKICA